MPSLQPPSPTFRTSFLAAMDEFAAEGRGGPDDRRTMIGHEIRTYASSWTTPAGFTTFTDHLRADALESTPRPPEWVPCTTWWWVENEEYLGRIALRHRLNDRLRREGGHIGYDVRPTARRQGHATAMLRAVLPEAAALGITPALLTCDATNVASAKVIRASGGVLQDEIDGLLRFWVPT